MGRLRLLLLLSGNTLFGLVVLFYLPYLPSNRCGFLRTSMMSLVLPLCIVSAFRIFFTKTHLKNTNNRLFLTDLPLDSNTHTYLPTYLPKTPPSLNFYSLFFLLQKFYLIL